MSLVPSWQSFSMSSLNRLIRLTKILQQKLLYRAPLEKMAFQLLKSNFLFFPINFFYGLHFPMRATVLRHKLKKEFCQKKIKQKKYRSFSEFVARKSYFQLHYLQLQPWKVDKQYTEHNFRNFALICSMFNLLSLTN